MFQKIILLLLALSCAHNEKTSDGVSHFSRGEIILSTTLLMNIHDQLMPPLSCVPDQKEAEILLRVIRPRLDEVDIYLLEKLDSPQDREVLFNECMVNCTCLYLKQLIKENRTKLYAEEKKRLSTIVNDYKISRQAQCLSYIQQSFCETPLVQELESEKQDFMVP